MRLIDFDRYHFLLPNQYPRSITVRGPSNLSAIWHNVFKGLLPWYHNILYFYHVLDMISRPLSEKSLLDRVGQENVLKASAIPVYDLSAMTAKRIGSYWVRQANPFLSILPGDLQTVFSIRRCANSKSWESRFDMTLM